MNRSSAHKTWSCIVAERLSLILCIGALFACATENSPELQVDSLDAGTSEDAWALYKALGSDCTQDIDCSGGFCSQGKCCTSACTGPCESCDKPGFEGQCLSRTCTYPPPFGWQFQPEDSSEHRLSIRAPIDSAQDSCFGLTSALNCPGEAENKSCGATEFCGQDAQYARRAPWAEKDRFVTLNEGFVLDHATQLVWRSLDEKVSWNEAKIKCEELEGDVWRLPRRHELMSLLNLERMEPATDFPELSSDTYWAQEALNSNDEMAWIQSFVDGSSEPHDTESLHRVACVGLRPSP